MKIVLLVLSGDANDARDWLQKKYSDATIDGISRDQLDKLSSIARVRLLRSMRADVFAVATERLVWQRGQNALMLFGALTGARRVVLLDAHEGRREETRATILSRIPSRLAAETASSVVAIKQSHARLRQLERASENRANSLSPQPARKDFHSVSMAYLRSTPSAGTPAGGAATHINGFVNAVIELGAKITFISNDRIAGLDEQKLALKIIHPETVGISRAAFDLHNNLIFSAGALREIEESPVDLIYQRYGRFTSAGVEASLRTGIPLFLEYNGSEVWIGKHWDISGMIPLLERFERLNLAVAARIFVVSAVERRNLLRCGIPDEKIVVNPNGVDPEKFQPGIGGAAVRRELGVAEHETLAGFVGTFGPWHGVLTLAEAITLLPDDSGVRFLLIGAGRLRDEVERIIRHAGKEQQVVFAGHVDHERVPVLLDACDILLSPHVPLEDGSEFFGSPTKLFEYMAMGKGIIASRLGQIGEVLVNEETALLTEPGNVRQLSEAILRLNGGRELRERMGAAARRIVVAQHTWSHNAQRVLDEYHLYAR